jgi:hypothetical protein
LQLELAAVVQGDVPLRIQPVKPQLVLGDHDVDGDHAEQRAGHQGGRDRQGEPGSATTGPPLEVLGWKDPQGRPLRL